jgi:murein L,D-transpeptidase YcbB/YkuD
MATPAPAAPVEVAPLVWPAARAAELAAYVATIGSEGLNPADYRLAALNAALAAGQQDAISAAANAVFDRVVRDLALGRVERKERIDWFVVDRDLDAAGARAIGERIVAGAPVRASLEALLPTHPQYGALKTALPLARDKTQRDRIRLNLDRWRWLPRDLGNKYIIVNAPSFYATLVEDGQVRWKQRAIAGKLTTPTPQLSVNATGVVLNPWWEVPQSLSAEVSRKPGYVAVKGKDGKVQRWRQPPGPANALGQLKFVMQNEHAIYLHDTNSRSLFNGEVRALSHGCVRTQHVVDLAKLLLADDNGSWTPDKVDATLASKKTQTASFVKPVPVHIVYFTAAALVDGTLDSYQDLYRRDARALAALNGTPLPPLTVKKAAGAAGAAKPAAGKPAATSGAKPAPRRAGATR